jgi:hypothetical protein
LISTLSLSGVGGFVDAPDGTGGHLDEVDVLRVAARGIEVELVQGRTAPERGGASQERVREQVDDRPADDQILLDLRVGDPRRLRAPGRDVGALDHASGSTFSFTSTRQRASLVARRVE